MKLNLTLFGAILIILGVLWIAIIFINGEYYTGIFSLLIVFIGINLFFVGILYKPKKRGLTLKEIFLALLIVYSIIILVISIPLIIKFQQKRALIEGLEKRCPKNVTIGEGQAMLCPPLAEVEAGRQGCVYNMSDKTYEQVRSGDVC